jgi:hypothetical protein
VTENEERRTLNISVQHGEDEPVHLGAARYRDRQHRYEMVRRQAAYVEGYAKACVVNNLGRVHISFLGALGVNETNIETHNPDNDA